MNTKFLLSDLVPAGFIAERITYIDDETCIFLAGAGATASCPACGRTSQTVRSRYCRQAADLPLSGRRVRLLVRARRFSCDAVLCGQRIFAERFGDRLPPYARRTGRLEHLVHHLALALGGRPAARFAQRLMLPVSKDTPTDFSYVQAVAGRPKSDAEEISVACHNAVSRDLLAMKQRQFDHFAGPDGLIACDITGNLVGYPEAHLSHAYPPFGMIVKEFRNLKGWVEVLPPGTLTASADAQISTHFSDKAVAQEFLDFHHDRAVLRIIGNDRPPISLSSLPIVKRPLRFR